MSRSIAIALALALAACTSPDKAQKTLEAQGFTNIKILGYAPMSCADDDSTCTKFEAKAPSGRRVHGAVGCGYMFKGCTIRLVP
jgi:hypothetical protein